MPAADTNPLMKVFLFLRDPQETLDAGFDRIKVEKSEDRGVTWVEMTDVDTRLIIYAGKYNYYFLDPDGDAAFLYRAVLSAVDGTPADVPQSPQQAINVDFEMILTVDELKNIYLFGVDLTNDEGTPYPDELYAHYIRAAISQTEMELDINLTPRRFDERHDFYRADWNAFAFLSLRQRPALTIERLAIEYPNNQTVIEFPEEWIRLDKHGAQIQIYPGNGIATNAFISTGGGFLPLIYGGADFIPGLIHVEYFAGLELGDALRIPNLKEVVGKRASNGPLNIAGDLVAGAGLQGFSIGIDGLSRSVTTSNSSTNAGYGARLLDYSRTLKDDIKMLKRYFGGARMTAV